MSLSPEGERTLELWKLRAAQVRAEEAAKASAATASRVLAEKAHATEPTVADRVQREWDNEKELAALAALRRADVLLRGMEARDRRRMWHKIANVVVVGVIVSLLLALAFLPV